MFVIDEAYGQNLTIAKVTLDYLPGSTGRAMICFSFYSVDWYHVPLDCVVSEPSTSEQLFPSVS